MTSSLPPVPRRRRTSAAAVVTAVLATTLTLLLPTSAASAAPSTTALDCSAEFQITQELAAGTTWSMCWRIEDKRGLILSDISVQTKLDDAPVHVIDELAMAQLNVPYDTGDTEYDDITSYGFGGNYLLPMTSAQCPDGLILDAYAGALGGQRPALCIAEADRGLAYHLQAGGELLTAQGTELSVSIISKVGWYEYASDIRFADDGEIDVSMGATGDLSPNDYADDAQEQDVHAEPIGAGDTSYAVNHSHNAFWRVDFGIGDGEGQLVERMETTRSAVQPHSTASLDTVTAQLTTETKAMIEGHEIYRVINPQSLNADGHARSYEITMPQGQAYGQNENTDYDLAFTQSRSDEVYASSNRLLNGAAPLNSVTQYVADSEVISDPVAWVNVGFHHVIRDEDQSPMPIHWQGFTMYPRDFTAQSPLIPDDRTDINGQPGNTPTELPDRVTAAGAGGFDAAPADPNMPLTDSGNMAPYAVVHVDGFYDAGYGGTNGPQNLNDGDLRTVWDGEADGPPTTVTLTWPRAVTLSELSATWFSWDEYNAPPASWVLQYYNSATGTWTPVQPTSGSYGTGASNITDDVAEPVTSTVGFTPVTSAQFRVVAVVGDAALALGEVQAWAGGSGPTTPTASASPTGSASPTASASATSGPSGSAAPTTDTSTGPAATKPSGGAAVPTATPGTTATVGLDPIAVGTKQDVTASGFRPEEPVTVKLHGAGDPVVVGTYLASDNGSITFDFTVPDVPAGSYTLVLTGQVSSSVATVGFDVVAADGALGWLASTGVSPGGLVAAAVVMLALGAALAWAARSARRDETSARAVRALG